MVAIIGSWQASPIGSIAIASGASIERSDCASIQQDDTALTPPDDEGDPRGLVACGLEDYFYVIDVAQQLAGQGGCGDVVSAGCGYFQGAG